MIRQAHTYLVSAMSGATLIAIAIAAFVVLVSAQVFRDWPLAALGDDSGGASVSKARPLGDANAAGAVGTTTAASKAGGRDGAAQGGRDAAIGVGARSGGAGVESIGSSGSGESASGNGGEPAGGGGGSQQPSTAPSQGPAGAGGSGSAIGSSGGSGGSGGNVTAPSGTGGGGSGSPVTAGATESPSATVTETVNGSVGKVDESVLGGTLESTGVTGVTEGVVDGAAGPESTVGKVVDETVKTVGGLLGNR
ncbi:MAG: hypothetical protein ABW065_10910 [Solirubrobacterales bacterium]